MLAVPPQDDERPSCSGKRGCVGDSEREPRSATPFAGQRVEDLNRVQELCDGKSSKPKKIM